jgi:hypothetical protein
VKLYIAMDIGCIECGQESACLGIFKEKELALNAIKEAESNFKDNLPYPWGDHRFKLFEMEFFDV